MNAQNWRVRRSPWRPTWNVVSPSDLTVYANISSWSSAMALAYAMAGVDALLDRIRSSERISLAVVR